MCKSVYIKVTFLLWVIFYLWIKANYWNSVLAAIHLSLDRQWLFPDHWSSREWLPGVFRRIAYYFMERRAEKRDNFLKLISPSYWYIIACQLMLRSTATVTWILFLCWGWQNKIRKTWILNDISKSLHCEMAPFQPCQFM